MILKKSFEFSNESVWMIQFKKCTYRWLGKGIVQKQTITVVFIWCENKQTHSRWLDECTFDHIWGNYNKSFMQWQVVVVIVLIRRIIMKITEKVPGGNLVWRSFFSRELLNCLPPVAKLCVGWAVMATLIIRRHLNKVSKQLEHSHHSPKEWSKESVCRAELGWSRPVLQQDVHP